MLKYVLMKKGIKLEKSSSCVSEQGRSENINRRNTCSQTSPKALLPQIKQVKLLHSGLNFDE
uniref:Uncharacterized protein n=1 Tax=Romanomermis culicivorax TaxID=13658 RepID=A0A915KVS3_ROMCU